MGDVKHIHGHDCKVDVPGHLRRLADEIENGGYPDDCVAVVILDEQESLQIALYGFGPRSVDKYVFAGLLAKATWVASIPTDVVLEDE